MNTRFYVFATLALMAASPLAEARLRGGSHRPIGDHATVPVARVPKKKNVGAPSARVRGRRGAYPFIGKRKTPKRTF